MERDFRLNWKAVVDEARHRRKTQGLTQRRLAAIAGVSTPTVSRFERNEKNVQLSSVLAILEVLGMTDRTTLTFPEGRYDWERQLVTFPASDGSKEVSCAISGEALEDHFGAQRRERNECIAAFSSNREDIEALARRKFALNRLEADGSVLIRSSDVE